MCVYGVAGWGVGMHVHVLFDVPFQVFVVVQNSLILDSQALFERGGGDQDLSSVWLVSLK